jgi:hypothetical protein
MVIRYTQRYNRHTCCLTENEMPISIHFTQTKWLHSIISKLIRSKLATHTCMTPRAKTTVLLIYFKPLSRESREKISIFYDRNPFDDVEATADCASSFMAFIFALIQLLRFDSFLPRLLIKASFVASIISWWKRESERDGDIPYLLSVKNLYFRPNE